MNKDKKRTVKPEGKIKHMLRTNYWLTPLLLVALVFAIVFGISKIPALKTTIQGWFNKHEECKQCESVNFDEFTKRIEENGEDSNIYVLFSVVDNEAAKKLFPKLDSFLETNKKDHDIVIINVDLTVKNGDEYNDKTLDDEKYNKFKQTFKDSLPGEGEFSTPSIIKYTGSKMDKVLTGDQDYNSIMEFFDVKE